ncbi:vacuolar protein sorting-like protein [Strigomonas culicis]|uniref:Vacuolar protein sorting-like protein n=1 Tax=Strigomonas culicis TaxID=28005 RepID=S9TPW5_9TRYP|nr:vacuolar protein sorting-like protein [Strigomonas culicis]|eukprot:EPY18684.1 vacuolar protein sorting-like protein [Strigomonas culicis]
MDMQSSISKQKDIGTNDVIFSEVQNVMTKLEAAEGSSIFFIDKCVYMAFRYLGLLKSLFENKKEIIGHFMLSETIDYLPADQLIYFVSPDLDNLRSLVVHILSYTKRFPSAVPHIYFVPHKPLIVEQVLDEEYKLFQAFPKLKLEELDVDMFFLEANRMSMEVPKAFYRLYASGDITPLTWAARGILKLQATRYGAIPCIRGKGEQAAQVVRMLRGLQNEVGKQFLTEIAPEIDTLLILDRSLDFVTPLLTQLTYEGLLDELYGINACEVCFPFSISESAHVGDGVELTNRDKVFAELRDKNFSSVGTCLYQKSVWVKQNYEKRKDVQQLKELKEFIKVLPEMQEYHQRVGMHTSIATEVGRVTQDFNFGKRIEMEHNLIQQNNVKDVFEYIEDLVFRKEPLPSVLRILCLYSMINGLKLKVYESIKESMMLVYGIPQIMSVFFNLERCGLLAVADGRPTVVPNYSHVRKVFQTWCQHLNEEQPNDIAYTYSGYAPPLARLVDSLIGNPRSWGSGNSLVDQLPGPKEELTSHIDLPTASKGSWYL